MPLMHWVKYRLELRNHSAPDPAAFGAIDAVYGFRRSRPHTFLSTDLTKAQAPAMANAATCMSQTRQTAYRPEYSHQCS